jgi:Flp pilus assembly protein TadD
VLGLAWLASAIALTLVPAPSPAAERGSVEVARLIQSTVCVLGKLANGEFQSSGFVVAPGDLVMTTAHGMGAASDLRVKLRDGRVYPARLERIGGEKADLALLRFIGPRVDPVALASVRDAAQGDEVVAIGCPLGFEFTVTRGVVSSIRESDFGYPLIQTDVPVNPGSSGGPLFDLQGRVIGIIKSAAVGRERIHFALPIDLGNALLEAVAKQRRAEELFNQAVLEARIEDRARLYRQVVDLNADFLEARFNFALTLEKLGRAEEAEREYREVLRLRPELLPAALNLCAGLYERGRFSDAIEVGRAALKHHPESTELRNNLAESYRGAGRCGEARREFEAILREHPGYAPAHYGLGVMFDDCLKDRKRAAEHYRRYLDLAPEAADAARVRHWLEAAESPAS